MSKVLSGLFLVAMSLALATVDYVNQSRRLGLPLGEMDRAAYAALLGARLGLGADLPEDWDARGRVLARHEGDGSLALFRGEPIDMAAFKTALRSVEPAGTATGAVSFARAKPTGLAAGTCVTNGAFKRCRVGD